MKQLKSIPDHLLTGLIVLLPIFISIGAYVLYMQYYMDHDYNNMIDTLSVGLKAMWLVPSIFIFVNLIGFYLYGSPEPANRDNKLRYEVERWDKSKRIIVTWVSKGDNHKALSRAVKKSINLLDRLGVKYLVEVVTDKEVPHIDHLSVHYWVVPEEYETENKAKYKARALHFLKERSHIRHRKTFDTWILHMDEESTLTPEVVYGIHAFIHDSPHSIGQGEIKYNAHKYGSNLLVTAIDAIRTGDDLGRFRAQFKAFGTPIFGMHGSFILVRETLEDLIGFDLGKRGSITEDAYFALTAYDCGYKFGWVDGHIAEQSPYDVKSILKQRRRWFCGLYLVATDPALSIRTRLPLLVSIYLWAFSWISPVVTITVLIIGGYNPPVLVGFCAILSGAFTSLYAIGSYRNLIDAPINFFRKLFIFIFTIAVVPISSTIEAVAVIYAIAKPVKTFDVVNKN